MSTGTLQRSFAEQHALNRKVRERLVNDLTLSDSADTIDSDRDGHLIMSPQPRPFHRIPQDRMTEE